MITAEIIQQTEARFAQRQPIRLQREAKIRSGRILEADTPERVKSRLQHLATRAVVIEGAQENRARPARDHHCGSRSASSARTIS